MRKCCALRATMILISFYSVLAGRRPARLYCENSGRSGGIGASARSGCAKQRSLLCPLSERRCRHPLLFAVLDLLVLLDQAKSTRNSVRRKTSDRFFGKYPLTFDSVFPARSRFTTFWHQKVAPKVSAGHLRRDRTKAVTERSLKTPLVARSLRAFHPLSDPLPPPVHK